MKQLILFLIRLKLGVKKYEPFQFINQKSSINYYYFAKDCLKKYDGENRQIVLANVSLNWLLNEECQIIHEGHELLR